MDGAHEAFYMVQPTFHEDGRISRLLIEDCNERAAEISGYPRAKLIGKCCTEIYYGKALQSLRDFFPKYLKKVLLKMNFMLHMVSGMQRVGFSAAEFVQVMVLL